MVESLADGMSAAEIAKAVDEYLEIGGLLDEAVKQQAIFDTEAFERATRRTLSEEEREEFIRVQHQANSWTYLGSGMTHPKFLATLEKLNPAQRKRLEEVAPIFC